MGSPQWSFGKQERRNGLSIKDVPGPGAYEIPKHGSAVERKTQAPPERGFGTQQRMHSPVSKSNTPGPGAYSEEKAGSKTPQWSFGSTPKMHQRNVHLRETPGPGSHG